MRRIVCVLLSIFLFCMSVFAAVAESTEEEKKDIFAQLGSFFSDAWGEVSEWTSQKLDDASVWMTNAWGDASQWVIHAWDSSSTWVKEIWGDATTWMEDSYESVSGAVTVWWAETFDKATDIAEQAGKWLNDTEVKGSKLFEQVKAAVASKDYTMEGAKAIFDAVVKGLGLTEEETAKVWETVLAYAEENGMNPLSAVKVALPYLLRLNADCKDGGSIPAVAVAQYLVGIYEKLGINSNEAAENLEDQLEAALSEGK